MIDDECYLKISDQLGKDLRFIKANSQFININTTEFEPGIYFVSLIKNRSIVDVKKVVLMRK